MKNNAVMDKLLFDLQLYGMSSTSQRNLTKPAGGEGNCVQNCSVSDLYSTILSRLPVHSSFLRELEKHKPHAAPNRFVCG